MQQTGSILVKHDMGRFHRQSIRLPEYDYTIPGVYFVTICARNRECLFGKIENGQMHMNVFGEIVRDEWWKTVKIRPYVELDVFQIMPNHFHGIVILNDIENGYDHRQCRGVLQYAPTNARFQSPAIGLGAIVRGFKSAVTKRINELRNTPGDPVWQRNYYEHIIRNDRELDETREYIANNPAKWEEDGEFLIR